MLFEDREVHDYKIFVLFAEWKEKDADDRGKIDLLLGQ